MSRTPGRVLAGVSCLLVVFAAAGPWTPGPGEAAPAPAPAARPKITAANAGKVHELAVIEKDVWRIVWRPDGKEVAFVRWERPVEVLTGDGLRPLRTIGEGKKPIHFAFSPDRQTAAFCPNGPDVEVLNLRTRRSLRLAAGNDQPSMAFSPDGKLLATGGYGKQAKVWDVSRGRLLRSLDIGPAEGGLTVVFSPDGKTLAVGNRNSTTHLFDARTGKRLHVLDKGMSHGLKFHPGGKTLAVAYVDGSVALWDVATGKLLRKAKAEAEELYTLDWSPAGDVLVTAGLRSHITLWDPKDLSVLKKLPSPEWVISVRFSPDGTRLLSAGGAALGPAGRKVRVWGLR